jgi:hypothetical protein
MTGCHKGFRGSRHGCAADADEAWNDLRPHLMRDLTP